MHPEDSERLTPVLEKYLNAKSRNLLVRGGRGPTERILYRLKDVSGKWRLLEGTADLVEDKHILMVSRDVSVRAKTELDLERARKELERQVEERTRELKIKSETLEETNTALKGAPTNEGEGQERTRAVRAVQREATPLNPIWSN